MSTTTPTPADKPPRRWSALARRLAADAAAGVLSLPVCRVCATTAYPLREVCGQCLSDRLEWTPTSGRGRLLASTLIHHSNEPYFRPKLPLRIGSVQLDAGPVVIAFLEASVGEPGAAVRIENRLDEAGEAVLVAVGASGASAASPG
ncbi:MAG: hypothetical protein JWP52_61 [Rhizobacter sp.]|nr:hypothetical protein [Rhizobacter sp.]